MSGPSPLWEAIKAAARARRKKLNPKIVEKLEERVREEAGRINDVLRPGWQDRVLKLSEQMVGDFPLGAKAFVIEFDNGARVLIQAESEEAARRSAEESIKRMKVVPIGYGAQIVHVREVK